MAKRKEAAFSATQIEQLRELYAQAQPAPQRDAIVEPPRFKRIENYTDAELTAAIHKAIKQMGNTDFWCLLNAFDAFIEKRRRKRGWSISHT